MILIVDDKIENITALKKILESHRLAVDTALSGEEALKKVLKNDYQLMVLDVQMPGMDGFEVAEAISGIAKTNDLPIIFLSAVNISKAFITKGYASGGHDYLVKPLDPDILVLKIRMFIKLREQAKELARTQLELRKEMERRKQIEERKDEFIGIASHELKTPLTSAKAYMQLAEISVNQQNTEKTLQCITKANVQINKLNQLITTLLDISKMESGMLDYIVSEFHVEQLIDNAVDIFKQAHPEWEVVRSGSADVLINGDAMRLEQVLLNYLSNAAKYAPGTNKIYLNVKVLPGDELEISVRDTGIGIDPREQVGLFKKFYRTRESANQYRGLGMGLYICAEIVKFHGGKYGVKSKPGEGSTFYFTLPIEQKNTDKA